MCRAGRDHTTIHTVRAPPRGRLLSQSLSPLVSTPGYTMKRAVTALALLLLLSIPGWANPTTSCVDSTAVPIDTVTSELTLATTGQAIWEWFVGRTSNGQTIYSINPESIHFTGNCDSLNGMSTASIFDLLAKTTVAQGIALGYTKCSTSCSPPTTVTVVIPACVQRTGTSSSTHFYTCSNSGCCIRYYGVCCPNGNGAPTVTFLGSTSSGCSPTTGCESTCP